MAQVVADRQTSGAINDFVQKPEKAFILEFPAQQLLEDLVVDGRVELPDVHLKAEPGAGVVPKRAADLPEGAVNAFAFDAGIGVSREHAHEKGLQDVHDGMMDDPVRVIGKPVNFPFFGFPDGENVVRGSAIGLIPQGGMQPDKVLLPVLVMLLYPPLAAFTLPGATVGQLQVLRRDDQIVQIPLPFHFLCFGGVAAGHSPY